MGNKVIILAGTAGAGKTSVAEDLLKEDTKEFANAKFIEGDALHTSANVEKMSSGIPLGDEDRWDWLEKVANVCSEAARKYGLCIATCSCLKKKYRDFIKEKRPDTDFYYVFLYGSKQEILKRLEKRSRHFMKSNMMESQFKGLELPKKDESNCCIVYIDGKSFDQMEKEVKVKITKMFENCNQFDQT